MKLTNILILALALICPGTKAWGQAGVMTIHVVNNLGTNAYWRIIQFDPSSVATASWTPTGSSAQPTGTTVDAFSSNTSPSPRPYPRTVKLEFRTPTGVNTGTYDDEVFTIPSYGSSTEFTWTLGSAAPPESTYCFTNVSSGHARYVLVNVDDNIVADSGVVNSGDTICWTVDFAYSLRLEEVFYASGEGTLTNSTVLHTWDGESGETNATTSANLPKANPGTVNPGIGPSATSQEVGSAIVNQLQDNSKKNADVLSGIADILIDIRNKVATNQTALTDADRNAGSNTVVGAAGVNVATVQGGMSQTGAVSSAFTTQMGTAGTSVGPTFTIQHLGPGGGPLTFSLFDNPLVEKLRLFTVNAILFVAKVIAIMFLYKTLRNALAVLPEALKGVGTSGWLQAAVVSIPQLFASLGGLGVKYAAVAAIFPTLFAGCLAAVVSIGTEAGGISLTNIASGLGSEVSGGWALLLAIVPIDSLVNIAAVTLSYALAAQVVLNVISAWADTTAKA